MIDEDRTMQLYGYTSDELSPKSHNPIVAVCDECGRHRVLPKSGYRDLCRKCATTPEGLKRGADARRGAKRSAETRKKMSDAAQTKAPTTDTARQRLSATLQGIAYDEWESFAQERKYCNMFNESCREQNREKYGRMCFVCGKDEINNGKRLSVHHVDMNKDQGCDDHEWSLVPLCAACHSRVHNPTWKARIEYLLRRN